MSRYLLDTNILSHLVKDPRGPVRARLGAVGVENVYTSVIVTAELRFGLAKRRSTKLAGQLELVLGSISVVPFAEPVDGVYADLRATLELAGMPIGAHDLWIAAQALHDGSVLVTDNVREFDRVRGLRVENWLRI